jgi:hypothetical protein
MTRHLAAGRRAPLFPEPDLVVDSSPLGARAAHRSLGARALVDQAKGLLMAETGLSEPEAFRRIQKASMDTRTPMTEIARALLIASAVRQPPTRR